MDVAVGTIMACNFILIHKSRNKPGKAGILIPKSHFFSLGTSSENSSRKTWPSLAPARPSLCMSVPWTQQGCKSEEEPVERPV